MELLAMIGFGAAFVFLALFLLVLFEARHWEHRRDNWYDGWEEDW